MSALEVFRPELHAYGMRAMIDATRDALGREGLAELLRPYGVTEEQLIDPTGWVSLEFVEAFLADMITACKDVPDQLERAAMLGMTPKYLGPLAPLFVIFGSPVFAFKQQTKMGARFNRTGAWTCDYAVPGRARMTFRPNPEVGRERTPNMCRCRQIQQSCVPMLFNCPRAKITHPECSVRGDAACVYEITWVEPRPRADAKLGTLLGAALGLTIGLATSLQAAPLATLAAGTALLGYSLGRGRVLRAELAMRVHEIDQHNDALDKVSNANDQRFSELLEAKREVDQKVAVRTAELRETSLQLEGALREIRTIDRAKTDFFNNVSHELRTPLTLILAPLEALLAGKEPAGGAQGAFEAMQRNAQRLLRLINQLLDLAKIDAGEMRIRRLPTDLGAMLRGIASNFASAARARDVELSVEIEPGLAPLALDSSWVESAITNILANALRVVPRAGHVGLRVRDTGKSVTIEIADDGPGMAPEAAARIFERFAQASDAQAERKGTGLGLAIAREAMRLHGGEISLRTTLGEGATFVLELPRIADDPTAAAAAGAETRTPAVSLAPPALPPASEQSAASDPSSDGPSDDAPLALVVEDNDDLRQHIVHVLGEHYRVCAASDGEEGLALARKLLPELIVSDVAMPKLDGFELCRALRAEEATARIPCLLVTARSDLTHVMRGFEVGANDYLVKPFHATELLARADVHVRLRRLLAQVARAERLATLGSLAATVAHNVRNPLSSLIAGLPAMRDRLGAKIDGSTLGLMAVMIECAERIERMTADLLDLSRVDREAQGELKPGAGLLASSRVLSPRIASGVTLEMNVDDQTVIYGRAGDLHNVFLNLLDNALRAVKEAGTIRVTARVEDAFYVVRIEDSGPGIDPSVIDRVFEPFFTTRAAGEGTGLGLAIARQVVEQHGGSIRATTSSLGGALLTLKLPLQRERTSAALRASATATPAHVDTRPT